MQEPRRQELLLGQEPRRRGQERLWAQEPNRQEQELNKREQPEHEKQRKLVRQQIHRMALQRIHKWENEERHMQERLGLCRLVQWGHCRPDEPNKSTLACIQGI